MITFFVLWWFHHVVEICVFTYGALFHVINVLMYVGEQAVPEFALFCFAVTVIL